MKLYKFKFLFNSHHQETHSEIFTIITEIPDDNVQTTVNELVKTLSLDPNQIFRIIPSKTNNTNLEKIFTLNTEINAIIIEQIDTLKKYNGIKKVLFKFKNGMKTFITPKNVEEVEKKLSTKWIKKEFVALQDVLDNYVIINTSNLLSFMITKTKNE